MASLWVTGPGNVCTIDLTSSPMGWERDEKVIKMRGNIIEGSYIYIISLYLHGSETSSPLNRGKGNGKRIFVVGMRCESAKEPCIKRV